MKIIIYLFATNVDVKRECRDKLEYVPTTTPS